MGGQGSEFAVIPIAYAGAGSGTTNTLIGPIDLSRFRMIEAICSLTETNTDAADTCDIYLQFLMPDGLTWDSRLHFDQFTGDMSAAATTPEVRRMVLSAHTPLDPPEESYETTGSLGGTNLVAGSVRNGPFPGKYRTELVAGVWTSNVRLSVVVVDADTDGAFTGNVYLRGYH